MQLPRILIAGTNSGCGKTTVAAGVMAALVRQNKRVQPFKVGPDYIDPMFHTYLTGRPSCNLDSWLLSTEVMLQSLAQHSVGASIAVIEGVMGLFDGLGGTTWEGSTAEVAQLTSTPVVLVVNAAGMSLSVAALIRGFQEFGPPLCLGGVIFNHVKSLSHFQLLKRIVEQHNQLPVLGYLPPLPEIALPSRHLGLVPWEEQAEVAQKMERLSAAVSETIDLELLQQIAAQAKPLDILTLDIDPVADVRIGVARDQAFNFYYQDNLDLLTALGAKLVFFSPLRDAALPEGIAGLYLGGGFPEMFAADLAGNTALRTAIRGRVDAGMPTYAECGGLMYLCRSLTDLQGHSYPMCGVFAAHSKMTERLQHFGYVNVQMTADNVLGVCNTTIRGHEFHHSIVTPENPVTALEYTMEITKASGKRQSWVGGLRYQNALGSYPHLHFGANPALAEHFVRSCARFQVNH